MSIREKLIHALGGHTSDERRQSFNSGYEAGQASAQAAINQHYAEHEYFRLTLDQFEVFRKLVTQGNVAITGQTTELQAGQIIGVNHALNILRDGFVVDVHTAAKPV